MLGNLKFMRKGNGHEKEYVEDTNENSWPFERYEWKYGKGIRILYKVESLKKIINYKYFFRKLHENKISLNFNNANPSTISIH